jgi:hypothetical protein
LLAGIIEVTSVGAHARARGPSLAIRYATGDTDIGEGTVVVIVVKLVGLGIVGNEQVHPSVVVVIEQRHTKGFTRRIVKTGLLGYIFEGPIAFVVKKRGALALIGLRSAVGFVLSVERAVLVRSDRPRNVVSNV